MRGCVRVLVVLAVGCTSQHPAEQHASAIAFVAQPSTTPVRATIAPNVVAQVTDAAGRGVAGAAVAIAIGTSPVVEAKLEGTLVATTDASGNATYSDLDLDWLGVGYTLVASVATDAGSTSAISAPFDETRVGDPCLAPEPACSSGCVDSDGDGLADAWELANGIDFNGDGVIDPQMDLVLAGADPAKQDLFVQYDWMDYATPGNACSSDADCTAISVGHTGETCSASGSCQFACATDDDCVARGAGHGTERCQQNVCVHTHDPDVLAPTALQAVVDSFAAHAVQLHLVRGHAVPHSLVVSFRSSSMLSNVCEGANAVSLYELKASSSLDRLNIAYHYALFAHYSGCDNADDCKLCPPAVAPDGTIKNSPVFGETGLAEISGNDFVISLGERHQDLQHEPGVFDVGSTFMHELGHNLGLRHGGGVDTPCAAVGDPCIGGGLCTATALGNLCLAGEDLNAKPNYISVMNYRYQFTGIQSAGAIGGVVPIAQRLDYSTQTLPTAGNTPGALDESNVAGLPNAGDPGVGMSEPAGLGGGTTDLFTYTDGRENGVPITAAVEGPVNWSGDLAGDVTTTNVQADLTCGPAGFGDHVCSALQYPYLRGHADWSTTGTNLFTYKFQCTSFGGPLGDGGIGIEDEPSIEPAIAAHIAVPLRGVEIRIAARHVVVSGEPGLDASSLRVGGVRPSRVTVRGAELVLEFADPPHGQLTGWTTNGQGVIGMPSP